MMRTLSRNNHRVSIICLCVVRLFKYAIQQKEKTMACGLSSEIPALSFVSIHGKCQFEHEMKTFKIFSFLTCLPEIVASQETMCYTYARSFAGSLMQTRSL